MPVRIRNLRDALLRACTIGSLVQLGMREWILPYDAARRSADSHSLIHEFLESTDSVAATRGNWDVTGLEPSHLRANVEHDNQVVTRNERSRDDW